MGGCAALGCSNSSRKGFLMKRFPKDEARRQEWLVMMDRKGWKPTDNSCLCEAHFEANMWEKIRVDGSRKLRRNAVPTIFNYIVQRRSKRRKVESPPSNQDTRSSTSDEVAEVTSTAIDGGGGGGGGVQGKVFNPFSSHTKGLSAYQNYPIHQDVRLVKLPFYDTLSEILKPSTLIPNNPHANLQEKNFYFYLTPQQISEIQSSRSSKLVDERQVHLRFCLAETACEQEDLFPSNLTLQVNSRFCPLPTTNVLLKPGTTPKKYSRPVDLTPYIKLHPSLANSVTVLWSPDFGPGFTASITLVRKLTSFDLIKRLREKGATNADYTRSIIKEKLNDDSDSEIMTTCLRVSLLCPLGKMRMSLPCRPTTCQHLQCFDSSLFLQMNERKPTWSCPVCDKSARYTDLIIDGYFKEVLDSANLPGDINEIELHKDGSWSFHNKEKNVEKPQPGNQTIEIIADDSDIIQEVVEPKPAPPPRPIEVIDLLSDSDTEEADQQRQSPNSVISLDSSSPESSSPQRTTTSENVPLNFANLIPLNTAIEVSPINPPLNPLTTPISPPPSLLLPPPPPSSSSSTNFESELPHSSTNEPDPAQQRLMNNPSITFLSLKCPEIIPPDDLFHTCEIEASPKHDIEEALFASANLYPQLPVEIFSNNNNNNNNHPTSFTVEPELEISDSVMEEPSHQTINSSSSSNSSNNSRRNSSSSNTSNTSSSGSSSDEQSLTGNNEISSTINQSDLLSCLPVLNDSETEIVNVTDNTDENQDESGNG